VRRPTVMTPRKKATVKQRASCRSTAMTTSIQCPSSEAEWRRKRALSVPQESPVALFEKWSQLDTNGTSSKSPTTAQQQMAIERRNRWASVRQVFFTVYSWLQQNRAVYEETQF